MIGIILDAGVSWRVQVFSCAAGKFDPVPDLNIVVFHRDSSSNVEFEIVRYIVLMIVRKIYQFLCRIHGVVDAREQKREPGPTYLQSC